MKDIIQKTKLPLLVVSLITTLSIQAQTDYTLTDSDVTIDTKGYITSCSYSFGANTEGTNLTIPNTLNGLSVKGIANSTEVNGNGIFQSKKLTGITLPATINYIGINAFKDNQIGSVVIPNSITAIEEKAFHNNLVESVVFEENSNLYLVVYDAFAENNLSVLTLPDDQKDFDGWIDFSGADLESNTITDFETTYTAKVPYTLTANDITIDDNGYITRCSYLGGSMITIPETIDGITVRGVANGGVFRKKYLTNIILPETLEYIGMSAFKWNQLKSVNIPDNVKEVSDSAFNGNRLNSIGNPTSLATIGDYAFAANNLSRIPGSVKSIGAWAFWYNNMNNLTIPNSVITIGDYAFHSSKIYSLTIPKSVVFIGKGAFSWNFIGDITFQENSNLTEIDSNAFFANHLLELTLPSDQRGFFGWEDYSGNEITAPYTIDNFEAGYNVKGLIAHIITIGDGATNPEAGSIIYETGEDITLSATPGAGETFLNWEINGEEITDISIDVTINSDTTIMAYFTGVPASGVVEINEQKAIIYPNPATDQITIEGVAGETLLIYNTTGTLVSKLDNLTEKQSVNVSYLPKGLYVVKAGDYTSRIIVE